MPAKSNSPSRPQQSESAQPAASAAITSNNGLENVIVLEDLSSASDHNLHPNGGGGGGRSAKPSTMLKSSFDQQHSSSAASTPKAVSLSRNGRNHPHNGSAAFVSKASARERFEAHKRDLNSKRSGGGGGNASSSSYSRSGQSPPTSRNYNPNLSRSGNAAGRQAVGDTTTTAGKKSGSGSGSPNGSGGRFSTTVARLCKIPLGVIMGLVLVIVLAAFIVIIVFSSAKTNEVTREQVRNSIDASLSHAATAIETPLRTYEGILRDMRDRYMTAQYMNRRDPCSDTNASFAASQVVIGDFASSISTFDAIVSVYSVRRSPRVLNPATGQGYLTQCGATNSQVWTVANGTTRFSTRPLTRQDFSNVDALVPYTTLPYGDPVTYGLAAEADEVLAVANLHWQIFVVKNNVNNTITSAAPGTLVMVGVIPMYLNQTNATTGVTSMVAAGEAYLPPQLPSVSISSLVVTLDVAFIARMMSEVAVSTAGSHASLYEVSNGDSHGNYYLLATSEAVSHPELSHDAVTGALWKGGQTPSSALNEAYRLANLEELYQQILAIRASYVGTVNENTPVVSMRIVDDKADSTAIVVAAKVLPVSSFGLRLALVLAAPRSYYYDGINEIQRVTMGMGIAAIVLVCLICLVTGVRIYLAMKTLLANMDLAANLKNERVAPISSVIKEVQDLATAFDAMNEKLGIAKTFLPQHLVGQTGSDDDDESDIDLDGHSNNSEDDEMLTLRRRRANHHNGDDDDDEGDAMFTAVGDDDEDEGDFDMRSHSQGRSMSAVSPKLAAEASASHAAPTTGGGEEFMYEGVVLNADPKADNGKIGGGRIGRTTSFGDDDDFDNESSFSDAKRQQQNGGGLVGTGGIIDGSVMSHRRVTILAVNARQFYKEVNLAAPASVFDPAETLTETMALIAKSNRGAIDSFHGDHFILSFNAVKHNAEGPLKACRAAMEILAVHEAQMEFSMGVATGKACVGQLGSSTLKRFSIVGPVYSKATTLEGICRVYGNIKSKSKLIHHQQHQQHQPNNNTTTNEANRSATADSGDDHHSNHHRTATIQCLTDGQFVAEVQHMCVVQALCAVPPALNSMLKRAYVNNSSGQQQSSNNNNGDATATTNPRNGLPLPPAKILYCIRSMNNKHKAKLLLKSAAKKYMDKRKAELENKENGDGFEGDQIDEDALDAILKKKKKAAEAETDEWLYEINNSSDISVLPQINTAILNYLGSAMGAVNRSLYSNPTAAAPAKPTAANNNMSNSHSLSAPMPMTARRLSTSAPNLELSSLNGGGGGIVRDPAAEKEAKALLVTTCKAIVEEAKVSLMQTIDDIQREAIAAASAAAAGGGGHDHRTSHSYDGGANDNNNNAAGPFSASSSASAVPAHIAAGLTTLASIDFYGALAAEFALELATRLDFEEDARLHFKLPPGFLGCPE